VQNRIAPSATHNTTSAAASAAEEAHSLHSDMSVVGVVLAYTGLVVAAGLRLA
jgi:hypothetical protein